MIRGVYFDWGGVLIENPTRPMLERLSISFRRSPETVYRAYQKHERSLYLGAIALPDFWSALGAALAAPPEAVAAFWRDALTEVYTEIPETFALVHALKRNGYRVGFLSNTEACTVWKYDERNYGALFNAKVASCEAGLMKPDLAIYAYAARKIALLPQEIAFLDDKEENAAAANKAGMHGICFTTAEEARRALIALGVRAE